MHVTDAHGGLVVSINANKLAAVAKEQELLAKDPSLIIAKRDMVKDWYWKIIGKSRF